MFENVETKLMADDKSKRGEPDRQQVAGEEPYEVAFFAKKHGISRGRAEMLIKKFGNDRAKLDVEAEKLKKQAG